MTVSSVCRVCLSVIFVSLFAEYYYVCSITGSFVISPNTRAVCVIVHEESDAHKGEGTLSLMTDVYSEHDAYSFVQIHLLKSVSRILWIVELMTGNY